MNTREKTWSTECKITRISGDIPTYDSHLNEGSEQGGPHHPYGNMQYLHTTYHTCSHVRTQQLLQIPPDTQLFGRLAEGVAAGRKDQVLMLGYLLPAGRGRG